MKLRSPQEITHALHRQGKVPDPAPDIRKLAASFVHGPLREAIEGAMTDPQAHHLAVNTATPIEAYRDTEGFVAACNDLLRPLGYRGESSHDGGGMYMTLYVTWDAPRTPERARPRKGTREEGTLEGASVTYRKAGQKPLVNLRWLLEHARDVTELQFTRHAPQAHVHNGRDAGGLLIAHGQKTQGSVLVDTFTYRTGYASYEVCLDWLARSRRFRGSKLTVIQPNATCDVVQVGDEDFKRLRQDGADR